MVWTKEDMTLVEKFIEIKNRGLYVDGKQLTEVYNRVLEKNVRPTSCGSCLRQRTLELEAALKSFKELLKRQQEASEVEDPTPMKGEENNELTEAEKMKERMAKVRSHRKINKNK